MKQVIIVPVTETRQFTGMEIFASGDRSLRLWAIPLKLESEAPSISGDLCFGYLNLKSFYLVFHRMSEHRRMRHVEDCQHWKTELRKFLLTVRTCHADGIVYG